MVEAEQKPNYDAFMKSMKEEEDVAKLLDQLKDSRKDVVDNATKAVRNRGFSYFTDTPAIQGGFDEEVREKIKAKGAEGLDYKIAIQLAQAGATMAHKRAATNFQKNLESMVGGEMSDEHLRNMVKYKPVADKASAGQRVIIDAYNEWQAIEDLAKRYEKGEEVSKEEAKLVRDAVAKGIGETVAANLKNDYDCQVQEELKAISYNLVMSTDFDLDRVKESGVKGMKKLAEKAKTEYDAVAKDRKLEDISRGIIREMAKAGGDREDYEKLINVVYEAGKKDKN